MIRLLKKAWDDGPMLFVYAVVAYFTFTALNIGERVPSFESLSQIGQEEPRPETVTPAQAGALEVTVTSLRARPTNSGITVNVTLELKNTGSANTNFRSDSLVLKGANGMEFRPEKGPKAPMTIVPDLTQLAPLTFVLTPDARGPYELQYAGNTVFTGYSV